MTDRIRPRTLKGFRDHLPQAMMSREAVVDTARAVCRSYGYSPIDTPALEYSEILLAKGGAESDKQLYRFEDHGGRDVALRFDLTVPLARFVAQHVGDLGIPFKPYHVGPVWRGENTQRGRYREFLQFDFDTIGTESLAADIETGLVIADLMRGLGFEAFTIRINNRRLLSGVLDRLGILSQTGPVLRALDKMAKVGPDRVRTELIDDAELSNTQADEIVGLNALGNDVSDTLSAIGALVAGSEIGELGRHEIETVASGMLAGGVDPETLEIDVATARGLDYYTGTVYETFLDALPGIGSVCSGGRYDDLASLYTNRRLPGVGASLGVDRVLAAMDELDMGASSTAPAPVLVVMFDDARLEDNIALAADLRRNGVGAEVYPEARRLGAQLKYGDKHGHRLAVIVGDTEFEAGTASLKDLATGESREIARGDLAAVCLELLGA